MFFPLCLEPETMLRHGGNSFHFTDKGVVKLNTWNPTTNIWVKYFLRADNYNTILILWECNHQILVILCNNFPLTERKEGANITD